LRRFTLLAPLLALSLAAVGAAGCSDDPPTLTVYSGREEEIVAPLLERFERESGIAVEVRYGDSAELAATIGEEGENTPADVFFAQDAGSLGAVSDRLAALPQSALSRVPERFRDPDGRWVGTSGRVRVVVYNTEKYSEAELPDTIFGFTAPRFKDRIGVPPTNASFQAFVTGMRLSVGEERTVKFLEALKDNGAKTYEKNLQIVEAVASGEIYAGLVNHYYVALLKAERPDAPVANHFLHPGDPGALVNVAGVGVIDGSDATPEAMRLVEYLLSDAGQRFYQEAEEVEYPLVAAIPAVAGLPPLASLRGPDVPLEALGAELERTLEILSEVGLTGA